MKWKKLGEVLLRGCIWLLCPVSWESFVSSCNRRAQLQPQTFSNGGVLIAFSLTLKNKKSNGRVKGKARGVICWSVSVSCLQWDFKGMHIGMAAPRGGGPRFSLGLIEKQHTETRAALLTFRLQMDCFLCAMLPSEIILIKAFCLAIGTRAGIQGKSISPSS